jgi:hypothetical protein
VIAMKCSSHVSDHRSVLDPWPRCSSGSSVPMMAKAVIPRTLSIVGVLRRAVPWSYWAPLMGILP